MSRTAAAALIIATFVAAPAHAQEIEGTVIDGAGDPIIAAGIELVDPDGTVRDTALSDLDGAFTLHAPFPGLWGLRVARIGFDSVRVDSLRIGGGERVTVVVRMGERAIALEPIEVTARRITSARLAAFYQRVERSRALGIGDVLGREEIEARGAVATTDLLRTIPSVRIERQGLLRLRGCSPKLYVDGVLLNRFGTVSLDEVSLPGDVEGIEVYRGFAQMPAEFPDPDGCGVVLVWTRRAVEGGRPWDWKRLLLALGGIALVIWLVK